MFFCAMTGVVLVSIIIVTATNLLEMNQVEAKAFTAIKKVVLKNELKEKAADVIGKAARLHLGIKSKNKIFSHKVIEFGNQLGDFHKEYRAYNQEKGLQVNQVDEVLKEFDYVKKTNREILMYISVLANMVDDFSDKIIKAEQQDLVEGSEAAKIPQNLATSEVMSEALEKLKGITKGLEGKNGGKLKSETELKKPQNGLEANPLLEDSILMGGGFGEENLLGGLGKRTTSHQQFLNQEKISIDANSPNLANFKFSWTQSGGGAQSQAGVQDGGSPGQRTTSGGGSKAIKAVLLNAHNRKNLRGIKEEAILRYYVNH